MTYGAFHWCYDATGHEIVWERFRSVRRALRRSPFSFTRFPIAAVLP